MRRTRLCLLFATAVLGLSIVAAAQASAGTVAPVANSGLTGSACVPTSTGVFTNPGPGISTNMLGTGPAYYEVGAPTGAFVGQRPKGVMLVIHGGAWYAVGKALVAWNRDLANRWRDAGWQTINFDYRGCAQSVTDANWFMTKARQAYPHMQICAAGRSAGGHLALMLAATRIDLACAIAEAGPSDLSSLASQTTYDKTLGLFTNTGANTLANLGVAAFGNQIAANSPVTYAASITARLLLGSGETDPLVPAAQNLQLAAAVHASQPNAYVDVALLPRGDAPWVHTYVSQASLTNFTARENALVAPIAGTWRP